MLAKQIASYSNTFAIRRELLNELAKLAEEQPSCNGIYLALPEYLDTSKIGVNSELKVSNWYDLKGTTNYLYASDDTSKPTLIVSDDLFNGNPSLEYDLNGSNLLRFKYPINVGTMVIVYASKKLGGYLLYVPRAKGVPPNLVYYDGAPSGYTTLWAESSSGESNPLYTSTSRINAQEVSPDAPTVLNSPRILTIKDIDTLEGYLKINGIGSRTGVSSAPLQTDGVLGNVAAVLCFKDNLDESVLAELEALAAQIYVNYNGPSKISEPYFKYLEGSNISIDFSQYIVDEFFELTSWSVISPSSADYPGLSFTGAVLNGTASMTFLGKLVISVLNSSGFIKEFEFDLEVVKSDPIAYDFPAISDMRLLLSAGNDGQGNTYGVYKDSTGRVTKWEDARRLENSTNPFYVFSKEELIDLPFYIESDSTFNSEGSVLFGSGESLTALQQTVTSNTSIWLYVQDSYGSRALHSGLRDIYGEGQLWTVGNSSDIHGSTSNTSQKGYVNNIRVNTFNYKLPLGNLYFIVAREANLSFNTFDGLRGRLAYFISWDAVLSESDVRNAVETLANRYVQDTLPYIHSTATEYRYIEQVEVDLTTKVSDLFNRPLTYTITTNHRGATITNSVLSFTAVTDEVLEFVIDVSADGGLTSRELSFKVDVALRDNDLYLSLKQLLQSQQQDTELVWILLPIIDTTTLSGSNLITWEDYRLNGITATATNIELEFSDTDFEYVGVFSNTGNSVLDLNSPITGKTFTLVYKQPLEAQGTSFLFGQDSENKFTPGQIPELLLSGFNYSHFSTVLANRTNVSYVSGYEIPYETVSIVTYVSSQDITIDSIAKDRLFSGTSFKGKLYAAIVLDNALAETEVKELHSTLYEKAVLPKYVAKFNFDSNLVDSSIKTKVAQGTAGITTSSRKFGSHSLELYTNSAAKYLVVPNDSDFATLSYEFTSGFWFSVNKASSNSETIPIVSYPDLYLSLVGNKIVVDKTGLGTEPLIEGSLHSTSINIFGHLELSRDLEGLVRLYINGILAGSFIENKEYRDVTSPILLGSPNDVSTSSFTLRLDDFMFYVNSVFHTEDFTPPAAPY